VPLLYSVEHFPYAVRCRWHIDVAQFNTMVESVDDSLMTAGGAPTAPASPAPLTPSGLAVEGTLWVEKVKGGTSPARGMV
jgi:hypothetical protein